MAPQSRGKSKSAEFHCAECGWETAKWVGRCGECQAWGSVEARDRHTVSRTTVSTPTRPAVPIPQVDVSAVHVRGSGLGEVDRVLGGGFAVGSVVLLSGEPGIGKSTLLLDVAAHTARQGHTVLYVSGEETLAQIRRRADRTACLHENLLLAAENDLACVLGHIEAVKPGLLILDSVQTIASAEVDGAPGHTAQVREVAATLVQRAKKLNLTTILVGHVTKDGSIAGPRLLEHLVDVVAQVDGDRHTTLRMIRATKNRFGPTDEVGCLQLTERGVDEVTDPSALFCTRRDLRAPGSCVTVSLHGQRPLLVEVQALVAEGGGDRQQGRRTVNGLDPTRVSIVAAVLANRLKLGFFGSDLFVATVGGAVLREPAADLPLALAIASSAIDTALPGGLVAFGEVGLSGEVRPVPGLERRVSEAARLGYTQAVVPSGVLDRLAAPRGLELIEVGQLVDVLRLGVFGPGHASSSRERPKRDRGGFGVYDGTVRVQPDGLSS